MYTEAITKRRRVSFGEHVVAFSVGAGVSTMLCISVLGLMGFMTKGRQQ